MRVEDLCGREDRVQAEGTGLVGNDRHNVLAELLVPNQVFQKTHERHGGGNLLGARSLGKGVERLVCRHWQGLVIPVARGEETAKLSATLKHVLQYRIVIGRLVVRRQVRVLLELLIRNWNA